jgi:hypothetical protein
VITLQEVCHILEVYCFYGEWLSVKSPFYITDHLWSFGPAYYFLPGLSLQNSDQLHCQNLFVL